MPKVGTGKNAKHYPYTPAGRQAARQESRATGKPVVSTRKVTTARQPAGSKKSR